MHVDVWRLRLCAGVGGGGVGGGGVGCGGCVHIRCAAYNCARVVHLYSGGGLLLLENPSK